MVRRLPPQEGEWIDRRCVVRFRFEAKEYEGFEGDTLSSALWAEGVHVLGRSFKYHRPRGVYSMAGHDANVIVEDDRHTNMRGDELLIRDGLDVLSVNTRGGVQRDWLAITDRFSKLMPVGFYYKVFHKPRWLFPFYERQIRKISGLGRINPSNRAEPKPKRYDFCDLLVVGSGPSGLSAAIAAAEQGVRVLVVDDAARSGGSLGYQWHSEPRSGGVLADLLDRAGSLDNIEIRTATQAAGYYADHWIALVDRICLTKLRAGAVLVAGGGVEQPAVFRQNDLPGVMLGSAAQRLMRLYAVKPFDRCVVLAANSDGYRVALDLHEAGVDVAAIADLRSEGETSEVGRRVADAGVAVHRGQTVYEAESARGKRGVVAAALCRIDDDGRVDTSHTIRIDCDGIAVSVGWAPAGGLLYQAGGRFKYAEHVHQFVPDSLPDGVFAAGRVNGVFDMDSQLADGRRAGLMAARHLGMYSGAVDEPCTHDGPPPSHPYPIFEHPAKKNFVELDEDVHHVDFVNAVQEGYDNIELLKRYTTVGMGPSQGKLANMNAVRILAKLTGRSINETGSTTSRPFHQPVSLAHLAGRRFHPHRHTPMHQWHESNGAVFIDVGAWKRSEYYKSSAPHREDAILAEARNVRDNVGMIDVGTLGKIEIYGPDAVAMLERTYTGRFAKLAVGKFRYCLACDESGVIVDDGVVARLGDDRFYVTATTSGVEGFFREMQRNAMLWGLNVMLVNASGRYAAMNIAGPRSREVLAEFTDIDLAAHNFPYVGVRQGRVADAPARVMRVGFVGELGYEIHVPSSYGLHVWRSLIEASDAVGIKPFGVEAQRLLRLEKGHLIVSQDTDALTTPYEADTTWAIGKDKSFFVGQRSLVVVGGHGHKQQLVGFEFDRNYNGPLPEECHLVIDGDDIAGRVTSIAHRSTLDKTIGMAHVTPKLAQPGTTIRIRTDGGHMTEAQVVSLPFFDPDNDRQKI